MSRTPTSSVRPASSVRRRSEGRRSHAKLRLIDQLEMERSDEEFEEDDDERLEFDEQ